MRKQPEEPTESGLYQPKMTRMGDADLRRLAALAKRLELPESAVVRMALRLLAEREGIE